MPLAEGRKTVSVNLEVAIHEAVKKFARSRGVSESAAACELLRVGLVWSGVHEKVTADFAADLAALVKSDGVKILLRRS